MEFIKGLTSLNRYSFMHKGHYKGNPNLFVVSWMNFSFKNADFGWGKPVYFGPGYMNSEGKVIVMNRANGCGHCFGGISHGWFQVLFLW